MGAGGGAALSTQDGLKDGRTSLKDLTIESIDALVGDGARQSNDWNDWTPARADAVLVGSVGNQLREALCGKTQVLLVYLLPEVKEHYRERHSGEFDISVAESLVRQILADPLFVTQSRRKANTLVFLGAFDEGHLLAVPVKTLGSQLWQETLYIRTKQKVMKRGWKPGELLYERK
jgi:hypothetical protein